MRTLVPDGDLGRTEIWEETGDQKRRFRKKPFKWILFHEREGQRGRRERHKLTRQTSIQATYFFPLPSSTVPFVPVDAAATALPLPLAPPEEPVFSSNR